MSDARQMDRLFAVIRARADAEPGESYTARLLKGGLEGCGEKFREEALELYEAARREPVIREALIHESGDVLYHWLVLLAAAGIDPAEVYEELARREGRSGLTEKAERDL